VSGKVTIVSPPTTIVSARRSVSGASTMSSVYEAVELRLRGPNVRLELVDPLSWRVSASVS
jgi:hypothetical protein